MKVRESTLSVARSARSRDVRRARRTALVEVAVHRGGAALLSGRIQLRVRLHRVVALHERFHGELPVGGECAGEPPLRPQVLDVPRVVEGGERRDRVEQRRRVGVEVDERAPAPRLDPHFGETEVGGVAVGFVEEVGLVHERVGAVEAPAPPVERADEPALVAPAVVDELHAAVTAHVVVRLDRVLVDAHDDHRLVEDLVLDVVARLRDVFQPARHLPHPRPQELRFHGEELRVVVAAGGDAVGARHRVGHLQRGPALDRGHGLAFETSVRAGNCTVGDRLGARPDATCPGLRARYEWGELGERQLEVAVDEVVGDTRIVGPRVQVADREAGDPLGDDGGNLLRGADEEAVLDAVEVEVLRRVGGPPRALEHVPVVRVPAVHHVLADLGPGALGVVRQEELHLPGHLRERRVVTAGFEPDEVRLVQLPRDRLEPEPETSGRARSHRPAEPTPHRHRSLDRRGCHGALGAGLLTPESAHLPDPLREHAVAVLEVAVEREVLGLAIPDPEARLDATVADDVDDCDLLRQLHRLVQREQRDRGADTDARGTCRDRSRVREALRKVPVVEEVVFREPDRIGAETLRLFDALEPTSVVGRVRARPFRWVAHVDVHPEPHRTGLLDRRAARDVLTRRAGRSRAGTAP